MHAGSCETSLMKVKGIDLEIIYYKSIGDSSSWENEKIISPYLTVAYGEKIKAVYTKYKIYFGGYLLNLSKYNIIPKWNIISGAVKLK